MSEVEAQNSEAAIRLLIQYGNDPDDPNPEGHTPLMMTAREIASSDRPEGLISLARTLLEAGANPNVADPEGQTPLHVIATRLTEEDGDHPVRDGHNDFMRLLLQHGADPTIADHKGNRVSPCGPTTPPVKEMSRIEVG